MLRDCMDKMKLCNYYGIPIKENSFYMVGSGAFYFIEKDEKRRLIGSSPTRNSFLLSQEEVDSFIEIPKESMRGMKNWLEKILEKVENKAKQPENQRPESDNLRKNYLKELNAHL